MKRLKILARITMLFFLFGCFNACEKDEFLQAEDDFSDENELALIDESNDITDDPIMAKELINADAFTENEAGQVVKYEYQGSQLVKMSYFRSTPAVSTAAEETNRLVKTDEFFYENERLTGLSRVFHNPAETDTEKPLSVRKRFAYDRSGRLTDIYVKRVRGESVTTRHEILRYNDAGQIVRKIIRGEDIFHSYRYDESGKLMGVAVYSGKRLQQVTRFFYTEEDNISHKIFYRPRPTSSNEHSFRRFIIKYDYEPGPNPFNWMKLPFGTLFDSMDEISNNNYIKIETPVKEVKYKYEYSLLTGFPLSRYTIE